MPKRYGYSHDYTRRKVREVLNDRVVNSSFFYIDFYSYDLFNTNLDTFKQP